LIWGGGGGQERIGLEEKRRTWKAKFTVINATSSKRRKYALIEGFSLGVEQL